MSDKVDIRRLPTGVPGLDDVLGGGIPEFSFNLIAGAPGTGKTTLAQQIMFGLARPDRTALYFTILGEPTMKMLRYQQQFGFFDVAKLPLMRFVNLADALIQGGYDEILERLRAEVKATAPGIVVVDSFRTVVNPQASGGFEQQDFVQRIGIHLTGCEATTFLIGEYTGSDADRSPVFTVADGVIWLHHPVERNSAVRKMQITKMRGQASIPGLHTFRMTDAGVQVFPRMIMQPVTRPTKHHGGAPQRVSSGVPGLDAMLGGGIPAGYSVLIVGPSGSGKSVLAAQFLTEGARAGEPGVIATFEKRPERGPMPHGRLSELLSQPLIATVDSRPLDLSIDETLAEVTEAIRRTGARRLVIDSLSGFELALAPTFREDFRESLYRMIARLTGMGVTVMATAELEDTYTSLRFSPHGTAFLTDAIIMQRYAELNGELHRLMAVVKVRDSFHSKQLHAYDITDAGITVGQPIGGYDGLLGGRPVVRPPAGSEGSAV